MGVIDKAVYNLVCPKCGASEEAAVLDRGSGYGGSSWGAKASFSKFTTDWVGGGQTEPDLTKATCNACGGTPTVTSRYEQ